MKRSRKGSRASAPGRPPRSAAGELRDWLRHDGGHAVVTRAGADGAKEAVLSYETLERRGDGTALLKVMLVSGRYHQIRAQFAHAGCPVVGDERYGSTVPYRRGCIALQHYCLRLEHPVTGEPMEFISRIRL